MEPEPAFVPVTASPYTKTFQQRFSFIRHRHLRALAFLLDSPGLLNSDFFSDKLVDVATACPGYMAWLHTAAEDHQLQTALNDHIAHQHSARLGLYAEKLLGFYLEQTGRLHRHGLQVRAGKNATIGEFDFLLNMPDQSGLLHWELATKFYLLADSSGSSLFSFASASADTLPGSLDSSSGLYTFVGPNLADSLGQKMTRIFQHQLKLAEHEASTAFLSAPVLQAQALIRGWLFYPCCADLSAIATHCPSAINKNHCHGKWGTTEQFGAARDRAARDGAARDGAARDRAARDSPAVTGQDPSYSEQEIWQILPRLDWLAPARIDSTETVEHSTLSDLMREITLHKTPLLVAVLTINRCQKSPDVLSCFEETERWFIVPDDWKLRAQERPDLISR